MHQSDLYIVLCNCPPDAAPALARALVTERLAACVNIIPNVRSIYMWQGEVCDEAEATLLIKTGAARHEAMRARLEALHPYTVPEIIAITPADVLPSYLAWALESVATDEP